MKPLLVAAVAIALGAGYTSVAQNMVEYINPPTKSTISQKGVENHTTAGADKSGTKSSARQAAIDHSQAISAPPPPAIFVLSSGERLQASRYTLTVDTLRIQDAGAERTIPLSAVDVKATTALNHERGLDLDFPKSKSQMTLSF